jgi:hypothetical protein
MLDVAGRHTVDALVLETEVLLVDTDQTSRYAVPEAGRESTSMRTVNTTMRELSGSFARSEPIAFFCECRDPTCFGAVWMTRDMFDATVAGHTDWMLLEGHEPSALWHTRELPPVPVTRGALRAVPDADDGVLKPTSKPRSTSVRQQLARAS